MNRLYFITGGTGSLGREVVDRLLRQDPAARVALLTRGADRAARRAKHRVLLDFLARRGIEDVASRVAVVPGDLERPNLGMATEDFARWRLRVTHCVHVGARIELDQPIHEARAVNVAGTRGVLAFAAQCPRLARFVHVSTAYVAGARQGTIREEELEQGQGFLNAYEQSKYEAERLVTRCRGAFPITVVRPSIVVGDSRNGQTCNFGTIYYPLMLVVKGAVRRIPGDPATRLDLVPVNHAAECIAALCGRDGPAFATYHIASGLETALPVGDLVQAGLAYFGRPGGSAPRFVTPTPISLNHRGELGRFFAYLTGHKDFDTSSLQRDLGPGLARCPDPREYLRTLFAYCAATRWGRELPGHAPAQGRAA